VVSALGYTAVNICMRHVSALQCDPAWATFNKELVTVVVIGLWLLVKACRGLRTLTDWRTVGALMLVGLATQSVANLGVQWAFGVVGLAVTVPAIFGMMLVASAVLGRVFLGERVSRRSMTAVGLLLASLVFLGLSASMAGKSIAPGTPILTVARAVGAACLAGTLYAVLTTTIRHCVTRTTPIAVVLFTITGMAMVTLGPLSAYRLGTERLLSTPPSHFGWMLLAGTMNLIAFLAITKGLQLTTVLHVNVLNASQVAMAAIAGIAIPHFHESRNPWLVAGVVLTIVGVVLIDRPVEDDMETISV